MTITAARMIGCPSDHHFHLRFMLALRPGVEEYIIKTHRVSAENSSLTQIRSACEDHDRINEYGKQVSANQTSLDNWHKFLGVLQDEQMS